MLYLAAACVVPGSDHQAINYNPTFPEKKSSIRIAYSSTEVQSTYEENSKE
jgi:hypothetical protein